MASIVVLLMGGVGARQKQLEALGQAHELSVVEPRFPDCKKELEASRPALVLVDGSSAPSHGRATAGWMAGRLRTVPFLFLDVPDPDVPKVKQALPRAQFGTWASVMGACERIVNAR